MVKEFTISSANTYEYQSLTFPGDTGGSAFNDDVQPGFWVSFPLVCGSNYQISADTWTANNRYATSNQQNLLDSTSNDVYIAGVSLIVGSVGPADFPHEDYGTALARCQRYFYRLASGNNQALPTLAQNSTTGAWGFLQFPVEMRESPTISYSNLSHFDVDLVGSDPDPTAIVRYNQSSVCFFLNVQFSSAGSDGDALRWYTDSSDATFDILAEL